MRVKEYTIFFLLNNRENTIRIESVSFVYHKSSNVYHTPRPQSILAIYIYIYIMSLSCHIFKISMASAYQPCITQKWKNQL